MNRNDKNYEEALKAYTMALKFDKENFSIMRDVCALQVHLRNYSGFNQILDLRPGNRPLWASLAASYHLLKNYKMVIKVLDTYDRTFTESKNTIDYEHSELLLYRNQILIESGDLERSLVDLETIKDVVFDKLTWKEHRAQILKDLNRPIDAIEQYKELMQCNPDNIEYIHGLLECDGLLKEELNQEELERVEERFSEMSRENPRSGLLKFLPLQYLSGEKFKKSAFKFIEAQLRKGVPSLFATLKVLYKDEAKKETLLNIVQGMHDSLLNCGKFESNSSTQEPPTAYLWTIYFLAQHHDKVGDHTQALELIDRAIEHTPTLVELHMTKARIYKHLGQLDKAMSSMDEARELDLQDRYVNTKCAKYMLRNDRVEDAEQIITLFVRPECTDRLAELFENQCLWFALESAKSFYRQGQLGMALKRSHQIYDFHNYCPRKSTMRPYVDMLKFEDSLYRDKSYIGAVEVAIQCYLRLFKDPDEAKFAHDPAFAKLSPEEKRKLRLKLRKAASNARQQESEDSAKKASNDKKDNDPKGEMLLNTSDPLGECRKLLAPLLALDNLPLSVHYYACQVFIAQGKLLLALKPILLSFDKDPTNTKATQMLDAFVAAYRKFTKNNKVKALIKSVIDEQLEILFKKHSLPLLASLDFSALSISN
ncbi:hypothetical protein L0F63_006205 [Massospora cicadina]|nr:hypothetical protein L0F63_006205 [Massospora cicadina]